MSEIMIETLFQMYLSTFHHCGKFLLDLSDEQIGTYLFEEFDIEATTFLHENTLSKLKCAELINEEEYASSKALRQKFMKLQGTSLWNVESVKTAAEWLEIMQLADSIRNSLKGERRITLT